MRATRAYIASLGTTGVLLASSLLMLLVVSTLVAFDGWGGGSISDDVEQLFVADDRPDLPLSGPEVVAADAASASRAVAARPAPTRGATRSVPPVREDTGGGGGGGAAPGDDGAGGGGGTVPAIVPGGTPGVPDPDRVRSDLSQTTRDTTRQAGQAVTPVSPQAGQAVTDTGQALSEIVDGLPATESVRSAVPLP